MDHFCLKWNNFQSSLVTAFESLQTTEDLADVTLMCDGTNVKAHKIILSAFSSYFRTVFKENPCHHPIVILKGVAYTDLIAILHFMYHGEVLIIKDRLSSFLQTAKLLQVSGLVTSNDFQIRNMDDDGAHENNKKVSKKKSEPLVKRSKVVKQLQSTNLHSAAEAQELPKRNLSEKGQVKECNLEAASERIKVEIEDDDEYDEKMVDDDEHERLVAMDTNQLCDNQQQQLSILERSLLQHQQQQQVKPSAYHDQTTTLRLIPNPKKTDDDHQQLEPYVELTSSESEKEVNLSPKQHQQESITAMPHHHSSQCGNCPHCGLVYSNQSALKYHVRLVHSDLTNMYCCHLCPESFDYRENYKRHMIETHNVRN